MANKKDQTKGENTTTSKLSNLSINEQIDLLNSILASSTEYSIIALDLLGNILSWNEGAKLLYGYEPNEIIGKNMSLLHANHDELPGFLNNIIQKAIESEKWVGQIVRLRKDKTTFTAFVSITVRKDQSGKPIGLTMISRNIDKEVKLQSDINEQNKQLTETKHFLSNILDNSKRIQTATRLKSEFLANMSHELRTPLNAIIGFAELMHSGKVGPISPEHKEYLGDILASSHHLLQLINDVLDLSKVESGKMEFHPEKLDLNKVVTEIRDVLRTFIAKKRINFEIYIDPSLKEIILDSAKLKQVLYNFISNALKFTKEEGTVGVKISSEDKQKLRIEVTDTGVGIKKEDLNRLFIEFQQLNSSLSSKYPGTGLGLALTKRIVEAQGGTVGVDSIFGKGSKFYAILPRTPLHQSQILAKNKLEFQTAGKANILVIEDDTEDQQAIKKVLISRGYTVEIAKDGKTALELVKKNKYDAITLDLMLPDMNGWEILHAIRTVGPNKHTPTIVITVIMEKLTSFGYMINNFLIKPIHSNELLKALVKAGVTDNTKNKKVLVIDNDSETLSFAKDILRKDYHVFCEDNAASGLKAAEKNKPDAIILNLLLPDQTAFNFLSSYRRSTNGKYTPIIVWTNKHLTESEKKILRDSANAVIFKSKESMEKILESLHYYFDVADIGHH